MKNFVTWCLLILMTAGCQGSPDDAQPAAAPDKAPTVQLSDADIVELAERSYQYVAMYKVNNKFAMSQGGWNTCAADTQLKDHTLRDIAAIADPNTEQDSDQLIKNMVNFILNGVSPVAEAPEVPAEYWEKLKETSERRITLAGYRIADPLIAAADDIEAQREFVGRQGNRNCEMAGI